MRKRRRSTGRALCAVLFLAAPILGLFFSTPSLADAGGDNGLYIIVHKDNAVAADEMSTTVVKDIFLKRRLSFPGGNDAEPINQKEDDACRKLFLAKVLKMTEDEYGKYWDTEKVRSGKTRPKEYSGSNKCFTKVTLSDDALAYVSKEYYDGLKAAEQRKIRIVGTVNK